MDLSVIIVSYNVRDYLRAAIASVITEAAGYQYEIIVIDNCSSDGSVGMVRSEFGSICLIESERNEGFGAACNKGIEASSGSYILILNPDTILGRNSLREAYEFMESHPEAGVAGARMEDGNGRFLPESKRGFPSPLASLFRFMGMGKIFPRSPFFNAYYLGHLPDDRICRADILTGAFMFIRREALVRAGVFDPDFFMFGEDIDLSWRIVKAGFVNYYVPSCRIIHFKGRSTSTNSRESTKHFYNAMIIFARKHLRPYWHIPVTAGAMTMLLFSLLSLGVKKVTKKMGLVGKKEQNN